MQQAFGLQQSSLALLTDLYQLTMAYGYWQNGLAERPAVFHLSFRNNPFGGGYAVACGLQHAIDLLRDLHFDPDDLKYLAGLTDALGNPLFPERFIEHLRRLRFTCDLDAVPEGTVVFPHEPVVRVRGPVIEGQLVETALLNVLNFQTLIATKAARVCQAARGGQVLEFGLRRAQGIDGGLAATRAAYIGGCAATSNVLAGKVFGIPVRGTHAHSWVLCFEDELTAFRAYARAFPDSCVLLVDTFDSLQGVEHAIIVARELRAAGHELTGIRLDSGDLAYLSVEARKRLDAAGFPLTAIVASNDLDEHIIASLVEQDAAINMWGVGTRLATAFDQPALGGVYKLTAIQDEHGQWQHKVKLSEQPAKVSTPGVHQVRRFTVAGEHIGDALYDLQLGITSPYVLIDPFDQTRRKRIPDEATSEDLLVPVFRGGALLYASQALTAIRERVQAQLQGFHDGIKRFVNPHQYPVGLEPRLHELRTELVMAARGWQET